MVKIIIRYIQVRYFVGDFILNDKMKINLIILNAIHIVNIKIIPNIICFINNSNTIFE